MTTENATIIYELDPIHTYAGFSIRHLMITQQRGQFHNVSGMLRLDRNDVTRSKVEAVIDVKSIDTHMPQRDDHLRSPDFFDVEKYPTITFASKQIERTGNGRLIIQGDLTMHGVTKSVVLDAEPVSPETQDPFGNIKVGTSATTVLSRREFGLVWNKLLETGGVAVSDEVKVILDLQFNRKS